MGVIRYDITEDSFSNTKLPYAELSILTGVDSSSYLIVDDEHQVLALRAIAHDEKERWWKDENRFQVSFRKTRLAWLSERFTIIPARLYDGNKRRSYLSSLTTLHESDVVLADAVPELDAFIVYALEGDRLSEWRRVFIGCRFYHMLTPLLDQLSKHNKHQLSPLMYAYFRDNLLVMTGMENGKLIFCNAYPCKSTKDFLYFLLLAYQQCQWNPSQVELKILGELLEDSAIYKLFYRYVKKMSFLKFPAPQAYAPLSWGKQSKQTPNHVFYDLVSLQLYH